MNFIRIGKLLIFYSIFYAILAAFFSVISIIYIGTLDDIQPNLILEESLIGTNPALNYKPNRAMISYKKGDNRTTNSLIRELDKFLAPYLQEPKSATVQVCFEDHPDDLGNVCEFSLSEDWAPCTPEYDYGYGFDSSGPCIFLKLNKIFGWIPHFYNSSNLPSEMPEDLKSKIVVLEKSSKHEMVWVECDEVFNEDEDEDDRNIESIIYRSHPGFQKKYFPYTNIEGYLSPLVVVHFDNPRYGVVINVECRAWAQNIQGERGDRRNVVRFQLRIEEPDSE